MRVIRVYLPVDLNISDEKIADLLEDFDYRQLPEDSNFDHRRQRREVRQISLSPLGQAELADHCQFYGKSFTTAIMQSLTLLNTY